MRSEEEILNFKLDLEQAFKDQLLMIREKTKQLQDDLMHEVRLKDIKIEEMQQTGKILEAENRDLKEIVDEMRASRGAVKANSVPREEHERVLREKVRSGKNLKTINIKKLNDFFKTFFTG